MNLAPGTRVGHLRIEARLGQGGMGEVYRAFDERLEREVALKAIRGERRWTPEAKARFLREARILSKLDHPNVCRIYDLVETPESDYLLLEYVEGQTLRAAMRDGLGHDAKLRLSEQVAAGLAAAHRLEIVHRDLKPENIMVTATGDAKILDFGIARPADRSAIPAEALDLRTSDPSTLPETLAFGPASTSDGTFHTSRGTLVGTATYMSPEQARGEAVTEASDLYSLGIVLHELFSQAPPYPDVELAALLRRVGRAEVEPLAGVDAELGQLIVALESHDPAARPDAAAARDRLRAIGERPRRRRRRWLVAAAAAGALLLAVSAALVARRLGRPPLLLEPGERARVAILPFHNATGDPAQDWVELGLAQMVAESLDATRGIDVLPVRDVRDIRDQLGLAADRPLDAEGATRLHSALGDNLIVETAVERRPDGSFEWRYSVMTPSGADAHETLRAGDHGDAAEMLVQRLVLWLRPEAGEGESHANFSADAFANRAHAIGLERRDIAGAKAARPYFEVALDRDPAFHWARFSLAEVAIDAGAPREGEALLTATLAAARQQGDRRLEARTLLKLGELASNEGDYPASDRLLRAGLEVSSAGEDAYTVCELTNMLASNAYYLDDQAAAERLWRDTLEQARRLGYRKRQVGTLNNLAALAYARGDLDGAQALWEMGLEQAEKLGHRTLRARLVSNLGLIENDRRHSDRAAAHFREALEIYRQTGYKKSMPIALFNLGETLSILGQYQEAESAVREGLAIAREIEEASMRVRLLGALAVLVARQGDDPEALRLLAEAQAGADETTAPEDRGEIAKCWAYVHLRRGRRAAAEHYLERAEAWRAEDSETRMLRARSLYLAARFAEARALAEATLGMPDTWSRAMDEELAVYRRAAELGQRLPLPDEGAGS